MSVSIKRHEIQKFIQEFIALHFSSEWFVLGKESLARRSEHLLQGIALYRLSHSKTFRLQHFLQVLVIPDEHVHLVLGGSVSKPQRRSLLDRLRGVWPDPWFHWESRCETLDEMLHLLRSHLEPGVGEPLALQSAAPVIAKRAADSTHWLVLWSDAMVKALSGDLRGAREEMVVVRDLLVREQNGHQGAGREVPAWIFQRQQEVAAAIDALADEDRFRRYCEETSRATAAALGLPDAGSA